MTGTHDKMKYCVIPLGLTVMIMAKVVIVFVKTHVTVFVENGEVVEDVSAEHDVLPGIHSQHHWHLIDI